MASILTLEALQFLQADRELQLTIEKFVGVKPDGLRFAINRNSKSLTTWFAVEAIANKMKTTPEQIIEVK